MVMISGDFPHQHHPVAPTTPSVQRIRYSAMPFQYMVFAVTGMSSVRLYAPAAAVSSAKDLPTRITTTGTLIRA